MKIIELHTIIQAPIEMCFDVSRSIEVHLTSTAHTNETVISGRASGLCEAGDTITWRARHFGIYQQLTVSVSIIQRPTYFQDKMIRGAFKFFTHDHYFSTAGEKTLMRDIFTFAAPMGILGQLAEWLFLERYMRELLMKRNHIIKLIAESQQQFEYEKA